MATYGYSGTGTVPFTGQTNTLGGGAANNEATAGSVYFNGLTQGDRLIARMMRNGAATLALRRIMTTLNGAVAGTTATQAKKQVQGVVGGSGGVVPVESVNVVNRATCAADVTAINALLFRNVFPASYPADLSGNGGGGKSAIAGGGIY